MKTIDFLLKHIEKMKSPLKSIKFPLNYMLFFHSRADFSLYRSFVLSKVREKETPRKTTRRTKINLILTQTFENRDRKIFELTLFQRTFSFVNLSTTHTRNFRSLSLF